MFTTVNMETGLEKGMKKMAEHFRLISILTLIFVVYFAIYGFGFSMVAADMGANSMAAACIGIAVAWFGESFTMKIFGLAFIAKYLESKKTEAA